MLLFYLIEPLIACDNGKIVFSLQIQIIFGFKTIQNASVHSH